MTVSKPTLSLTVSEKLRALDDKGILSWGRAVRESALNRPAQDPPWWKHSAIKLAEKSVPFAAALPQIVAVVEAAEQLASQPGTRALLPLDAALAALDEVLT